MKPAIIYNVFIRDFKKQRKRITLTLLALCWGTLSIMLLLGFGEGLQQQMTIVGKGMGDGIAIMWGGQTSIPYKGMGKGRPIRFYADDIEYLRKTMPELEMVGGEISMWGVRIKYKDNLVSEHVVGVTPNYEIMRNMIPEAGGRMINEKDMKLTRRVAFLGDNLKERLFGAEEAVATAATMYGTPRIQNIVYKPADLSQNAAVERRMFEVLGAKYRFDPDDDRALSVWDTVEGKREFTKLLIGVKIFLGIIGGLTLLIAGVGVANIMYVSIRERS
jgi:putative ABC transport system permease protein